MLIMPVLFSNSLLAATFTWQPRGDEPAFKVDVPNDWESDYLVKNNGAIVYFRDDAAVIEVRAFVADDDISSSRMIDLKAARLSARYTHVTLLAEKKSSYREGLYLSKWRMVHKNKTYIQTSGFIVEDDLILSISCIAPDYAYNRYRTVFDNALLSLSMAEIKVDKNAGLLKLKQFFIFNRPNSETNIVPKSSSSSSNSSSNANTVEKTVKDLVKKK